MRVRLPTVAFAAALVALLVAPTPARAFNLFPSHWIREETHAEPCSDEARERAELTRTCPGHCGAETCECSATTCPPPSPVDRGAVHGPLGVGTAAAMRRAVDRAVTTARVRLKNLNLHLPSRGSDKEDTPTKKEDATTVSVADILDDLERQLFLASPASLHSVAHHESPLSALARAGHGVLNVFPSLGIPEKAEKRFAEQSRLLRSAMDVHETDEFIEFVADVPGANDDDLEVEVLKKDPNSSSHQELDVLVVRGKRDVLLEEPREEEEDVEKEKRNAEGSKLGTFRVRERHFGAFENRYALPPSVDVDRISAKTSKGVLTVTAPKLPVKPGEVPKPPQPPERVVKKIAVAAE
jgi:HSP20 family protein